MKSLVIFQLIAFMLRKWFTGVKLELCLSLRVFFFFQKWNLHLHPSMHNLVWMLIYKYAIFVNIYYIIKMYSIIANLITLYLLIFINH